MHKAVVRNSIISGLLVYLIFVFAYFFMDPGEGTMEDINNSRSIVLFLNGLFFPGIFYGVAMILALPQAPVWKKLVFLFASGILHSLVAFSGVEGDLFLLVTAALAGPTMVFLVNGLLWPGLNTVRQALIGLVASLAAAMPLYFSLQNGLTVESPALLGLTSFVFWPVFMSYVLVRFRWPTQVAKP